MYTLLGITPDVSVADYLAHGPNTRMFWVMGLYFVFAYHPKTRRIMS